MSLLIIIRRSALLLSPIGVGFLYKWELIVIYCRINTLYINTPVYRLQ